MLTSSLSPGAAFGTITVSPSRRPTAYGPNVIALTSISVISKGVSFHLVYLLRRRADRVDAGIWRYNLDINEMTAAPQ
jgi:hypothetical protein